MFLCCSSDIHAASSITPVSPPTGTLLQFLPQLEELDMSWNELIGGCLPALTSHLRLLGGVRALRLCSCRLSADDLSALGGSLLMTLRTHCIHTAYTLRTHCIHTA